MGSEIEKLRALLEEATPGEWKHRSYESISGEFDHYIRAEGGAPGRNPVVGTEAEDCALIEAMHTVLPALLDVCEAAEACAIEPDDDGSPYVYVPRRDVEALRAALSRLGGGVTMATKLYTWRYTDGSYALTLGGNSVSRAMWPEPDYPRSVARDSVGDGDPCKVVTVTRYDAEETKARRAVLQVLRDLAEDEFCPFCTQGDDGVHDDECVLSTLLGIEAERAKGGQ